VRDLQTSAGNAAAAHVVQRAGSRAVDGHRRRRYMDSADREHFRGMLLDWREDLMAESQRYRRSPSPDAYERVDRIRRKIRKIDAALEEIATGAYGYCHSCGNEIGIRRLEDNPLATRCANCGRH
jgi:DnaK suppressor protein